MISRYELLQSHKQSISSISSSGFSSHSPLLNFCWSKTVRVKRRAQLLVLYSLISFRHPCSSFHHDISAFSSILHPPISAIAMSCTGHFVDTTSERVGGVGKRMEGPGTLNFSRTGGYRNDGVSMELSPVVVSVPPSRVGSVVT
eukprot:747788-Hanusia_phi.AAC.5